MKKTITQLLSLVAFTLFIQPALANAVPEDVNATGGEGNITLTWTAPTQQVYIAGCTNPEATNFNPNADSDDGSCELPEVVTVTDSSGSEVEIEAVEGCTNSDAENYNANANLDDGSCEFGSEEEVTTISGCTDSFALNYNVYATTDDGSCEFAQAGGVDEETGETFVLGCTDPNASNYSAGANVDNATCEYSNDFIEEQGCVVKDCWGNCAEGYEQWQGDGVCDDGQYGVNFLCPEWNFDNGDCIPDANDCNSDISGDGYCDHVNNNPACEFDGGDCCASSCSDGEFTCSDWVCSFDACHDPAANNNSCFQTEGGPDLSDQEIGCSTPDGMAGFKDCNDMCVDASYLGWVGDAVCDDGEYGINFDCAEWNFDGCDCPNSSDQCANVEGGDDPADDFGGGNPDQIGAGLFMFDYSLEGGSGPMPLEVGNRWTYDEFGPDGGGGVFELEITEVNAAGDVWTMTAGPVDMYEGETMSMNENNTMWIEDNGDGTWDVNYDFESGVTGWQFDLVFQNSIDCMTSFTKEECESYGGTWNADVDEIVPSIETQSTDGFSLYNGSLACTTTSNEATNPEMGNTSEVAGMFLSDSCPHNWPTDPAQKYHDCRYLAFSLTGGSIEAGSGTYLTVTADDKPIISVPVIAADSGDMLEVTILGQDDEMADDDMNDDDMNDDDMNDDDDDMNDDDMNDDDDDMDDTEGGELNYLRIADSQIGPPNGIQTTVSFVQMAGSDENFFNMIPVEPGIGMAFPTSWFDGENYYAHIADEFQESFYFWNPETDEESEVEAMVWVVDVFSNTENGPKLVQSRVFADNIGLVGWFEVLEFDPCPAQDCFGNCLTPQDLDTWVADWQGDGFCDQSLDCDQYNFDGGDCTFDANSCGANEVLGCNSEGCFPSNWVGDDICDPPLNCEAFDSDGGDCEFSGPAMPFNQVTFELDRDASTIEGEGYLPLTVGNTWIYKDAYSMDMGDHDMDHDDMYDDMDDDDDGPPACIMDCPNLDIIESVNQGGNVDGNEACTVIVGWATDPCVDDCPDDGDAWDFLDETIPECEDCLAADTCNELLYEEDGDDMGDGDGGPPACLDSCTGNDAFFTCDFESDQNCFTVYCDWVTTNYSDEGESCWDGCEDSYNPEFDGSLADCGLDDGSLSLNKASQQAWETISSQLEHSLQALNINTNLSLPFGSQHSSMSLARTPMDCYSASDESGCTAMFGCVWETEEGCYYDGCEAYDDDQSACETQAGNGCEWMVDEDDDGDGSGDCEFNFTGCEGLTQDVCYLTMAASDGPSDTCAWVDGACTSLVDDVCYPAAAGECPDSCLDISFMVEEDDYCHDENGNEVDCEDLDNEDGDDSDWGGCIDETLLEAAFDLGCSELSMDDCMMSMEMGGEDPGCIWTGSQCQGSMFTLITSECMMLSGEDCMANPDCVDMESLMDDMMGGMFGDMSQQTSTPIREVDGFCDDFGLEECDNVDGCHWMDMGDDSFCMSDHDMGGMDGDSHSDMDDYDDDDGGMGGCMDKSIVVAMYDSMCPATTESDCGVDLLNMDQEYMGEDDMMGMFCTWNEDDSDCESLVSVMVNSTCSEGNESDCSSQEGNCVWGTPDDAMMAIMIDLFSPICEASSTEEECSETKMGCMWDGSACSLDIEAMEMDDEESVDSEEWEGGDDMDDEGDDMDDMEDEISEPECLETAGYEFFVGMMFSMLGSMDEEEFTDSEGWDEDDNVNDPISGPDWFDDLPKPQIEIKVIGEGDMDDFKVSLLKHSVKAPIFDFSNPDELGFEEQTMATYTLVSTDDTYLLDLGYYDPMGQEVNEEDFVNWAWDMNDEPQVIMTLNPQAGDEFQWQDYTGTVSLISVDAGDDYVKVDYVSDSGNSFFRSFEDGVGMTAFSSFPGQPGVDSIGGGGPSGEDFDCNGNPFPLNFVGDGYCDDGMFGGANLDCEDWGNDGGDCGEAALDDGQCLTDWGEIGVVDCNGLCGPGYWIGDGYCDDIFDCQENGFDGGDCSSEIQSVQISERAHHMKSKYQYYYKQSVMDMVNSRHTHMDVVMGLNQSITQGIQTSEPVMASLRLQFNPNGRNFPSSKTQFGAMILSNQNTIAYQRSTLSDPNKYNIYKNDELLGQVNSDVTTYEDTAVASGVEYCYKVSAVYSDGESPKSGASCATPTTSGSVVGCMTEEAVNYDAKATEACSDCCVLTSDSYFAGKVVWDTSGNPSNPMNIYVTSATISDANMEAGDEIAVYDGNNCVGYVMLDGEIAQYASIVASADDGDGNGFSSGKAISFKFYDASESDPSQALKDDVVASYTSGESTFSEQGTSVVTLSSGATQVSQSIELSKGWNIFSSYVTPSTPTMAAVLNDLVGDASLVKMQDESGNAVVEAPGVGWIYGVDEIELSEGYYIKVGSASTLNVSGSVSAAPTQRITLNKGWNIMGYPFADNQSAATLLQSNIESGAIEKVQDESGNSMEMILIIEDTFVDNIGNLSSGEGYYVKVSTDGGLQIDVSAPDSGSRTTQDIVEAEEAPIHFERAHTGNPFMPMNIYLSSISFAGKEIGKGMELGVFDGDVCVGSVAIDDRQEPYYSIVASKDDPTTLEIDGYASNNKVSFRLWDGNKEYTLNSSNQIGFEAQGTAVVALSGSVTPSDFAIVSAYPNPFNPSTTIEFSLPDEALVDVSIFDIRGRMISSLVSNELKASGTHSVKWDASGNSSGIYIVKIDSEGNSATQRLLLIK